MEGGIREIHVQGPPLSPGRPPLWEKELEYSGGWIGGPAFESRAGTTTSSRWGSTHFGIRKNH